MTETANQDAHTHQDCRTNVYIRVPMDRVVVSIRCRREIKDALKRYCLANGLSLCHLFEALASGYLQGVHQQIEFVNKSPTINVSVVREVKRRRRYAVDAETAVVTSGSEERCAFCGSKSAVLGFSGQERMWLCKDHFAKMKRVLKGWWIGHEPKVKRDVTT